jgi:hypothetical protein
MEESVDTSPELREYDAPRLEYAAEPATLNELIFRHSGHIRARRRIFESLKRTGASANRLDMYAQCGASAVVQRTPDDQQYRIRANYCHDRFCVACGTGRSAEIASILAVHVKPPHTKFLTLTLRHSPTPLTDQIKRLYDSFTKLRHRQSWTSHVQGGAAFCEIKLSDRDGLWHVHLHILANMAIWPQRDLSAEWHAVTGDSYIVDIRHIQDTHEAAAYVAKYVSKPADAYIVSHPDKLDEMIVSLRGRRLCLTFGSWRGIKLSPPKGDNAESSWINVGKLDLIIRLAAQGDDHAKHILSKLNRPEWFERLPPSMLPQPPPS